MYSWNGDESTGRATCGLSTDAMKTSRPAPTRRMSTRKTIVLPSVVYVPSYGWPSGDAKYSAGVVLPSAATLYITNGLPGWRCVNVIVLPSAIQLGLIDIPSKLTRFNRCDAKSYVQTSPL